MDKTKPLLDSLRCRLEAIARDPAGTSSLFSLRTLLTGISAVYGGVMALRAQGYAKGLLPARQLPCHVIAIGNLTAGGTGKTPMTIHVARLIRDLGYRVAVISRGYRGRMESAGGIVSDGVRIYADAGDAGDEPYLMAKLLRGVPVVVGKNRHAAGMLAIRKFQAEVVVLDDAFQHLKLKRDLDIVLLDDRAPFGNGHLLPRGVLREPMSALRRAGAIVRTRGSARQRRPSNNPSSKTRLPVFFAGHHQVIRDIAAEGGAGFMVTARKLSVLSGKTVLAFAGLADNAQFFDAVTASGCRIVRSYPFADHHRYRPAEIAAIMNDARNYNADFVLTTLKDAVKIVPSAAWPVPMLVIDVTIDLREDHARFRELISRQLDATAGHCRRP